MFFVKTCILFLDHVFVPNSEIYCTKNGKIITHVFMMVLHRTQKHNRPDFLWKKQVDYLLFMFANKTPAEHGKYYLFMAKTFHYLVQKHDPKIVCRFSQRILALL